MNTSGTRESHAGEEEAKVIQVNTDATIEIHGEPKLSWTKLSTTLPANTNADGILYHHYVRPCSFSFVRHFYYEKCFTLHF